MSPEQRIKEQRMVEATRKGFTGMLNSKFGCILQFMGEPIKSHGSPLFEVSYLDDPYENENDEDLPIFAEDEMTTDMGYFFDGLSRGMHLEIKFIDNILTVSYKGYPVYREAAGDLEIFFPDQEWEKYIENLYNVAVKQQREVKKEIKHFSAKKKEAEKNEWLRGLWKKWGFKI